MKLSKYFQIINPQYVYLRLKPNYSIRNNNTHKLARAIAVLYKNIFHSITVDERKVIKKFGTEFTLGTKYSYMRPSKLAYYIYMQHDKIEFYFIVPQHYLAYIREKLSDVWGNVTIEEVEEPPQFTTSATKYELIYEKEDPLSLAVDRRNNDLLSSNLNVVELLEEGDKVGIFYNFMPTSQFSWKHTYKATIEKVNNRMPVDRDKTGTAFLLKYAFGLINTLINDLTETLAGSRPKDDGGVLGALVERLTGTRKVSETTARKANAMILDTQIIVMSESPSPTRRVNAARSLAQSFDTISEDNRLLFKPYRKTFRLTDYDIKANRNKVSDEEASNFLALAGRELLEQHNFIERVETNETEVPEDLREGVMCIGTNTYRGHEQPAYISTDKEYQNLSLIVIGPNRAGKSTLLANLSKDAIDAGECVIIFDFISQCELSSEVAASFPKDKVLEINCDDFSKLQGLGYNEVGHSNDPFEVYDNAKKQTTQFMTLINSVNADETKLTAKMQRYLTSASLVSFISGGSIRDIFDCLQDHEVRHRLIKAIPSSQKANLSKYVSFLKELDDYDKKGELVGTKDSYVVGIIDRLNQLEANAYMEKMLDRGTKGNIDLVEEMQKNQLICIKMPSDMFSTDAERDIYTTYWSTKIWLALQMRAKRYEGDRSKYVKVNLLIDELYQVNHTEQFIKSKLSQFAKFGLKPILSAHYLNQIKYIREELRSANASYMLVSGCDKKNYEELRSELYPYQEEDLLKLPRYHSLNLIKSKDGYGKFITKLPKPC